MNEPAFFEEEPLPDRALAPLSSWERAEFPDVPTGPQWRHYKIKQVVRLTDIYSQRRAEEKALEEAVEANVGRGEKKEREPVGPTGDAWLLAELKSFLEHLQNKVNGETNGSSEKGEDRQVVKSRIRPVRTPRSDVPLTLSKPAQLLRPEFTKGRLYFSCPCCRFPAALPVWLAGKKARCPRCYSAIRAPHPRKGLKTRVLENDIESVLHPERFVDYRSAHRLIPWLGMPRPKMYPVIHSAALVLLFTLLGFFVSTLASNRGQWTWPKISGFEIAHSDAPDLKVRARKLVEQFISAQSVADKAGFVRDSQRVAPLMADWYQRHPQQLNAARAEVAVSDEGFYPDDTGSPVTGVRVTSADGGWEQIFAVEHGTGGDRIEWEASVGYNPEFKSLSAGGETGRTQTVRVMGCFDDYYNFKYGDPDTHLCVRFHDPQTLERIGYGYIPLDDKGAEPIAAYLDGATMDELRPMMMEIRAGKETPKTQQVEIVRMVETGWRNNPAVADTGRKSATMQN